MTVQSISKLDAATTMPYLISPVLQVIATADAREGTLFPAHSAARGLASGLYERA
jgi:hypothetical protein